MKMKSAMIAVSLAFLLGVVHVVLARGGGPAGHSSHADGMSSGHMSEAGQVNTNAQFLPDSKRGLDRAEERMNKQGLAHEKATDQTKQQGKTKAKKAKPANGKKNP